MADPVQPQLGDLDERVGEVAGERRAAELVVDDAQRVALAGEAEHGRDEVPAVAAEQPGGADDRVLVGRGRRDGVLTGELGAPVRALRRRRGGLQVRLGRRPVEDVVRRDLDRERARPAAAAATWPAASPFSAVAPASSASAPSTSVQAAQLTTASGRAAPSAARRRRRRARPGRARERDHVVPGTRRGSMQIVAEHASGTGQEQAHRR